MTGTYFVDRLKDRYGLKVLVAEGEHEANVHNALYEELTKGIFRPETRVKFKAALEEAGLRIEDMVKSRWVYRKLRNFRAGIEAGISCLKRAYGLARCTWRGLGHFKAYVWSSVVAYNLALFARLRPT